jgi:hypothetical protein
MTNGPLADTFGSHTDSNKYYIMYDPTTVDLMCKIDDDNFTVVDIVEHLTGKNWKIVMKKITLNFSPSILTCSEKACSNRWR